MESNYIVRLKNNFYCFYYTRNEGICCKTFSKSRWSKPMTVFKSAGSRYSVSISYDSKIYLFCQDSEGNMVLCTREGDLWINRIILSNKAGMVYTVLFNSIITEKGLFLIYNAPSKEDDGHYLLTQQLNEKGEWSAPERIDKIVEMRQNLYEVQNVSGGHMVVFYQTRTPENNLGYREVTPSRYGKYNIFHTTNFQITDHSFLTTDKAIHVAYVVKGMFSSQLIYRKKENEGFSSPLTVYEAGRIENCSLFIVKENLYICFMNNSQLYYLVSENRGDSFKGPVRYRNKLCQQPVKCMYISEVPQSEQHFFLREVYVDSLNPHDIQIIPDLYEDFYPQYEDIPQNKEKARPEPVFTDESMEMLYKLKNQLSEAEKRNEEKDRQIVHLTNLLKIRNEEIIQSDNERKAIHKKYLEQAEEMERLGRKQDEAGREQEHGNVVE